MKEYEIITNLIKQIHLALYHLNTNFSKVAA